MCSFIATDAAFNVIDNVSMSVARKSAPPPTSSASTTASINSHQVETSLDHITPSLSSVSVPAGGFMQFSSLDAVHSKSDVPESLKSTYGPDGVGTSELLHDTTSDSMTPAPNFDLVKQLKSDLVQPLPSATNEPPKPEHKEERVCESSPPDESSSDPLHDPVPSLGYDQTKSMKSGLIQHLAPPSSNTSITRVTTKFDVPPTMYEPHSSIAQQPQVAAGNPIPSSGSEHVKAMKSDLHPLETSTNADSLPLKSDMHTLSASEEQTNQGVDFDEEDKLDSTHYDPTSKGSKIQSMGGVPLSTTTTSNRNVAHADTLKGGKGQIGLDDEKANMGMTSDISQVKQHGLSHTFFPKKQFDGDPLHRKVMFHEPSLLIKSPSVSDPEFLQSKLNSNDQNFMPPNDAARIVEDEHEPTSDQSKSPSPPVTSSSAAFMSQGSPQPLSVSPSALQPITLPSMSREARSRSPSPPVLLFSQLPHKPPVLPALHSPTSSQGLPVESFSQEKQESFSKQRFPIAGTALRVIQPNAGVEHFASVGPRALTTQHDSESTDSETDEESRISITPSSSLRQSGTGNEGQNGTGRDGHKDAASGGMRLRLRQEMDPMSSVEKDDIQRTPSPTSGGIEFTTSGAWKERKRTSRTSGVFTMAMQYTLCTYYNMYKRKLCDCIIIIGC